jgi:hypothetical protein
LKNILASITVIVDVVDKIRLQNRNKFGVLVRKYERHHQRGIDSRLIDWKDHTELHGACRIMLLFLGSPAGEAEEEEPTRQGKEATHVGNE